MKRKTEIICAVTAIVMILLAAAIHYRSAGVKAAHPNRGIRVGFVYVGDESTPYTHNFIRAQRALESKYGDRLEVSVRNNVPEDDGEGAIRSLAEEGCDLIFTTSYGYGEPAKAVAAEYPQTEFCAAACANAGTDPVLPNYHTFMGEIHEGRYVAGVVAGMKLREMTGKGEIRPEEAVIGFVAAFPHAEVISGYTAFLLGVRSVVPQAVMKVKYTDTWSDYKAEKSAAEELIGLGCVIISQHTGTAGPAAACEEAQEKGKPVFHAGYNRSMDDVAPAAALVGTRINWNPYFLGAAEAVFLGERIENHVDATIRGSDAGAGFKKDWVQMTDLNMLIAAEGSAEAMGRAVEDMKAGRIQVFRGDYTGTDPFEPADTINLAEGYEECRNRSAPSFHYVLNDVIEVL